MTVVIVLAILLATVYVITRKFTARKAQASQGVKRAPAEVVRDIRRLGYRYADDLVFIQGSGVFTGVVMNTSPDDFASEDERADLAIQPVGVYQTLINLFGGSEIVNCHEMVRYRPITTHGWLRQLWANAWNPTELYKSLTRKLAEHIKLSTPQRMWVLIVRLGDFPRGHELDPLAGVTDRVSGVADEVIDPVLLARFHQKAHQVHYSLSPYGVERLSRRDLLWLIRKPSYGHLPVPVEPIVPRRPWRGGYFELAATLRATIPGWHIALVKPDADTDAERRSYTATLVLADQKARQVFSHRSAWAPRLARLERPVDITMRYQLIPAELNLKQGMKAVGNIRDEENDRTKANATPDVRFETRTEEADRFENDNADDPAPGMIGRLRLTVSAPTPEGLSEQITAVKAAMGDVTVFRPERGQAQLLEEQFPGEGVTTSDFGALSAGPAGGLALWARRTDTYAPALGLLGAHSQVGDRVAIEHGKPLGWIGVPIGYAKSNGTVVHFDVHAQMSRLNGAGVGILGASGGGKTSLALVLFFWLSESGVRTVVIDPKIEFRNFVYYIAFGPQVLHPDFMTEADAGTLGTRTSQFKPINPTFWADTEIIDLAAGPRGLLCPWRITNTFDDGYNLALETTDLLFGRDEHRAIAKKALRQLQSATKANPAKVGYADILPHLRQQQEIAADDLQRARDSGGATAALRGELEDLDEVITRIDNGMTAPFIRLIMGKGSDDLPSLGTGRRRTIFTMAGYESPENPDQPDTWTDTNRNTATAMRMVLRLWKTTLGGRIVPNPVTGMPGREPSAKIVDEAYLLAEEQASRRAMAVDLRQGRSLDSALFYIDQQARGLSAIERQATDAGQQESNQFGTIFGFFQRGLSEARSLLSLLRPGTNIDANSDEYNRMARQLTKQQAGGSLRPGDCAMRDPDGRAAVVVIDQFFKVLQRASETNPKLVGEAWSHPVPSDPEGWEIDTAKLLDVRTNIAKSNHGEHETAGGSIDTAGEDLLAAAFTSDDDDPDDDEPYDNEAPISVGVAE